MTRVIFPTVAVPVRTGISRFGGCLAIDRYDINIRYDKVHRYCIQIHFSFLDMLFCIYSTYKYYPKV